MRRQAITLTVVALIVAVLALLIAVLLDPPTSVYLLVALVILAGLVAIVTDRSRR